MLDNWTINISMAEQCSSPKSTNANMIVKEKKEIRIRNICKVFE